MKVYVVEEFDGHNRYLIDIFGKEKDAIDFTEDRDNREFYERLHYKEVEVK